MWRFGETYRLLLATCSLVPRLRTFLPWSWRRYVPPRRDALVHNHRRENHKRYKNITDFQFLVLFSSESIPSHYFVHIYWFIQRHCNLEYTAPMLTATCRCIAVSSECSHERCLFSKRQTASNLNAVILATSGINIIQNGISTKIAW
jgi:hypothetical protein